MSVGSGIPYNQHLGNGVSTLFAYGFTLLDAGDLVVTIDGVATSAYTVAGIGVAAGGSITFSSAPANDAAVLIQRVIQLVREAEYQTNGDLQADTVNGDFDRLWMAVQGVDAVKTSSIRAPFPEELDEIPAVADRADKLLSFNSLGHPIVVAPASGTSTDLAVSLASSASASVGAGMIGFDATLNYALATIGWAAKAFNPTFYPWLADPTGATDATAAINACAAAAGANSVVQFPAGSTFLITGTLQHQHDFQVWSCYGSIFNFAPTADDICYERKAATASNSAWGGALLGARFTSANSTWAKTAVEVYDARIFAIRDLIIGGTVVRGSTNFWSGTSGNSTGLRIRGRELVHTENIYIAADKPFVLAPSPNTSVVGVDHCTFLHTTLLAYLNAGVTIEDGTIITQCSFLGRLSINLAREGIKWHDTTGTVTGNGLTIQQLRAEQPESTAYPVLDVRLTGSARMQAITIDGGFCNQAGPYLRGVDQPRLESWTHGLTGVVCLDIDSTVSGFDAANCFWQDGSTANTTGHRVIFGLTKAPNSNAPLPSSFTLQLESHVQRNVVIGGAIAQAPFTLANAATASLGATIQGVLAVTTSEGFGALFVVHGSQAVCELVSTTISDTYFSNTAATATKVNVYWSGAEYIVQNLRGGSRNIRVSLAGSYGTF